MIASMVSRLLAVSAYHKVFAVLLAGCVVGFVLGQVAHQQPVRGIAAAITSPAQSVAVIAGALGKPVVAPPPTVVLLGAPRTHPGDGDARDHGAPHPMPLGWPGKKHHPPKGGAPAMTNPAPHDD